MCNELGFQSGSRKPRSLGVQQQINPLVRMHIVGLVLSPSQNQRETYKCDDNSGNHDGALNWHGRSPK